MSSSSSPPIHQPSDHHWFNHIHGRVLYPLLIVLNISILLVIYYFLFRFLYRKILCTNDPSVADDRDGNSSTESSPRHSVSGAELSREFLSSLESFDYAGANNEKVECSVCLTKFMDGDKGRVLPRCNHRFHAACVEKWFVCHSTCPNCRSDVAAKACDDVV